MLKIKCIIIGIFVIVNLVECSKILCVFPSPSPSHLLVAKALTKELALRGHEVSYI